MNKKEYLEAQRELEAERKAKSNKAFEARLFLLQNLVLIIAYIYLPWVITLQQLIPAMIFCWGVGGLTVIVLYDWIDIIKNNKKEVENNGRKQRGKC